MASGPGVGASSRPPISSDTKFQLPRSSSSSFSNDVVASPADADVDLDADPFGPDAPLPFPTALARNDFLSADFNAPEYLSRLFPGSDTQVSRRHQTLEDLRAELRERSSAIGAQLLALVNSNYTAFLDLGEGLKGGGDKVEDVRVAILGFRRQVEEVQSRVRERREDIQAMIQELRAVRGEVELGRRMLELDERCEVLLWKLEDGDGKEDEENDGDGDDDLHDDTSRLLELAREFSAIDMLADEIGRDVTFVRKMEERIARCRNALLVGLAAAIKEARMAEEKEKVSRFLGIYRVMGAHYEAVKTLKEK